MQRKIIKIDEELCNGCGLCIPNCPEGAMQVIDGKVRLVSDLFCDGLGACVGHCPEGALTVEEREAEVYDEKKVMANIVTQGENVIMAHLSHLLDHGETGYVAQAKEFLASYGYDMSRIESNVSSKQNIHHGCPGANTIDLTGKGPAKQNAKSDGMKRESELGNWPVQLHLASPMAPYFQKRDVLFASDCVAYALADFHKDYLQGKSLIIACPKLDSGTDEYIEKLTTLFDNAEVASLTVMIIEVPCCGGLVRMVDEALKQAKRKIPYKIIQVGIRGNVLAEEMAGV
jgi:NAD-dependent dihydropyrimidine dehydrogenase PreA subunit